MCDVGASSHQVAQTANRHISQLVQKMAPKQTQGPRGRRRAQTANRHNVRFRGTGMAVTVCRNPCTGPYRGTGMAVTVCRKSCTGSNRGHCVNSKVNVCSIEHGSHRVPEAVHRTKCKYKIQASTQRAIQKMVPQQTRGNKHEGLAASAGNVIDSKNGSPTNTREQTKLRTSSPPTTGCCPWPPTSAAPLRTGC